MAETEWFVFDGKNMYRRAVLLEETEAGAAASTLLWMKDYPR
jgi:hypothetical protein